MLMSRRVPVAWREKLRISLWPRRSWSRSLRYLQLRMRRMAVVPRSLALGAAVGVFVAVLPIPGLQFLAAAGLAWLVRGHRGAAALATFAANPVTYPLIWVASYVTGATLLGTPIADATHDLDAFSDLMAQSWRSSAAAVTLPATGSPWGQLVPIFKTLAIGALPLALVSALAAYVCVRGLLQRRDDHQKARSAPIVIRATARRGISRQLAMRPVRDRRAIKAAA